MFVWTRFCFMGIYIYVKQLSMLEKKWQNEKGLLIHENTELIEKCYPQ